MSRVAGQGLTRHPSGAARVAGRGEARAGDLQGATRNGSRVPPERGRARHPPGATRVASGRRGDATRKRHVSRPGGAGTRRSSGRRAGGRGRTRSRHGSNARGAALGRRTGRRFWGLRPRDALKWDPAETSWRPEIARFYDALTRFYICGVPARDPAYSPFPRLYAAWFDEISFYYEDERLEMHPEYSLRRGRPGEEVAHWIRVTNTHPTETRRFAYGVSPRKDGGRPRGPAPRLVDREGRAVTRSPPLAPGRATRRRSWKQCRRAPRPGTARARRTCSRGRWSRRLRPQTRASRTAPTTARASMRRPRARERSA